jgi:cytochrome b
MSRPDTSDMVEIKVWDLPTRLLHWTNALLVLSLIALVLLHELGEDINLGFDVELAHAYIGHVFVVTFILRIIWGFFGNEYARLSDMFPFSKSNLVKAKARMLWMLRGFKGRAPVSKGHDPIAVFFYFALFFVLISQSITGLVLSGGEFGTFPGRLIMAPQVEVAAPENVEVGVEASPVNEASPLVYSNDGHNHVHDNDEDNDDNEDNVYDDTDNEYAEAEDTVVASDNKGHDHSSHGGESPLEELFEELHELGYYFMILFIFAHLGGIVLHWLTEGKNLIASMIHGRKSFRSDEI